MDTENEPTFQELVKEGRRLIQSNGDLADDRSLARWVDRVADWLDLRFPNTGYSAEWSAAPGAGLTDEDVGRGSMTTRAMLKIAVRRRLKMLAKFGEKLPQEAPEDVGQAVDTVELSNNVFVVHGHDNEMKEAAARVVSKLGLNPVILHEQPNAGKTLIEKFERFAEVPFAVVLLSPDDMAYRRNQIPEYAAPRARQNVILELGYFAGKIGRDRIFVLRRDEVEVPSDFAGIVYTPFDSDGGWKLKLVRELRDCGYNVDANNLA